MPSVILRPTPSTGAREDLGHQLSRSPTLGEVCAELGVPEEDVVEMLTASDCYSVRSLDAPAMGTTGPGWLTSWPTVTAEGSTT